ncbi:MAG: nicotinate-nucleotide diphosphorylase [Planctomycetia bacterium]|nr:nicotinate-nucleotide diphosphorylase [Planctomycetia bacterium]
MKKQFHQIDWDDAIEADWHALLRLAANEDLGLSGDLTTRALVSDDAVGRTVVVARQQGVVAGLLAAEMTAEFFDPRLLWTAEVDEGRLVGPGDRIAILEGPAAGILTAERTLLNVLSRLSGIATLTARYVKAVEGTKAAIYDTRKTTPGWRRLEKYAVRGGGGCNHRTGLFEAILIKDNHLALAAQPAWDGSPRAAARPAAPAEAIRQSRRFIDVHVPEPLRPGVIVEIEVDTLGQLDAVLPAGPDIVLLDNMSPDELRRAVAQRDAVAPEVVLEASGGVNLDTIRAIAESGVDRISVGALTHSAVCLDLGLDWADAPRA